MMASVSSNNRVPIICVTASTWDGARLFNPNSWTSDSKGIIQSCLAEFSALHHCVLEIARLCKSRDRLCEANIEEIQRQWRAAKFPIEKSVVFCEQPNLHICIEAFFAGTKSFLDLIVQLLESERVVSGTVHGFHQVREVYGGSVINALQNNASKTRKELAGRIEALLIEHKSKWIDQLIKARDELIHPKKGAYQLMFQLDFAERNGGLVCTQINAPAIGSTSIDQYTNRTFQQAAEFASAYLKLLQTTGTGTEKTE